MKLGLKHMENRDPAESRDRAENEKRKKRILIAAAITAAVLLLIAVGGQLILLAAIGRLRYEAENVEVPVIDPAFAAGQGIRFPEKETIRNPDVINILLLGTDFRVTEGDRGRADSNMLCSLNTRTGEIKLVSFERGIGVPVPGRGSDILTHAHSLGGSGLSQAIISQMFGVYLNGYAEVDFGSFAELIDMIGGVDVELTELEAKALNGEIPTQTWAWKEVHEGWNHLGGHDTLEYCRLRSIDSDWNRQRRQRVVLEQVQKACRAMPTAERLRLINSALPMIGTNLSREDLLTVIRSLPKLMRGSVTQLQVPDRNGSEGTIRCIPDYEAKKIDNFLYHTEYDITSPY